MITSYKSITELYFYYKQVHVIENLSCSFILLWLNVLIISLSKYLYYSIQMNNCDFFLEDLVRDTIDQILYSDEIELDKNYKDLGQF